MLSFGSSQSVSFRIWSNTTHVVETFDQRFCSIKYLRSHKFENFEVELEMLFQQSGHYMTEPVS